MFFSNFEYLKIKIKLYTVYFTDDENIDTQCIEKETQIYNDKQNQVVDTATETIDINMGKKFNYLFI